MEKLLMSKKERERKVVMENVMQGLYTLKEGSRRLGISYRQALRIKKHYQAKGDRGLIHKKRGQPSGRGFRQKVKEAIIKRYERIYEGFGPTLASEKLEEMGYKVNRETLRQWLVEAGLWEQKARKYRHRQRRERRERFGDLLQIDGSIHRWFSDERYTCLINAVDDATSRSLRL